MRRDKTTRSYSGNEKYIFISYRHTDIDIVKRIVADMQGRGYRIWWDEGIKPSEDFTEVIATRLKDCDVLFSFLSEGYLTSDFCLDELNYGIKNHKKIVPIKMDEAVLPSGIDLRLIRIHMIFMKNYDTERELVDYLCEECDEVLHECRGPYDSVIIDDPKPIDTRKSQGDPGSQGNNRQDHNDSGNAGEPVKNEGKKFPLWIPAVLLALVIIAVLFFTGILGGGKPGGNVPQPTAVPTESLPAETAVPTEEETAPVTPQPTASVGTVIPTMQEISIPTISAMDINRSGNNAKNYLASRLKDGTAPSTADCAAAYLAGAGQDMCEIPSAPADVSTGDLAVYAAGLLGSGNFSDVRSAQTLLDEVLQNRSGEQGFTDSAGSSDRNTADNLWLYKAFQMLSEKTGNDIYKEAARSAESFVQSMRSPDSAYFLAGDYQDNGERSSLFSVDTQALAAILLRDRSGIEKTAGLRGADGLYSPDELSAGHGSTETTALMALAFKELGMEEMYNESLSAVSRYQLSSGGIPESASVSFTDGAGRSCSNAPGIASTAWFILAAKGEILK